MSDNRVCLEYYFHTDHIDVRIWEGLAVDEQISSCSRRTGNGFPAFKKEGKGEGNYLPLGIA
jgi:hypothetical protein